MSSIARFLDAGWADRADDTNLQKEIRSGLIRLIRQIRVQNQEEATKQTKEHEKDFTADDADKKESFLSDPRSSAQIRG